MSFEVIETSKDHDGEFVRVWDGGRDKKGHRAGIHTFYVDGAGEFPVGRKVQIEIELLPEEPKDDDG